MLQQRLLQNKRLLLWFTPLVVLLYWFRGFNVEDSFGADPLIKLYQTHSLIQNNFASEEFTYPAHSIDREFQFFPLMAQENEGSVYHLVMDGKNIGQYPLFFSLISAPLLMSGGKSALFLLNFVPLFLMYGFFLHQWRLHPFTFILAVAGTPWIIYALEYNDLLLVTLFTVIGFYYYFHGKSYYSVIASGFLLGVGSWMRLETFVFILAFALAVLIVESPAFLKEIHEKRFSRVYRYLFFQSSTAFAILLFLVFNYLNYGHILGPRFLVNYSELDPTIVDKFKQMFVLFFGGYYKLGFFGFTPLFFISVLFYLIYAAYRVSMDRERRVSLVATVIFLPLAAWLAQGEAGFSWGPRYLSLALFPALLTTDSFIKQFLQKQELPTAESSAHWFYYAKLLVFSLLILHSIFMASIGIKMIRGYQKGQSIQQQVYSQVDADIRLFSNDFYIINSGTSLMTTPTLYAKTVDKLQSLIPLLKKNAAGKTIVYLDPGESLSRVQKLYTFPETLRPMEIVLRNITSVPGLKQSREIDRKRYLRILNEELIPVQQLEFNQIRLLVYRVPT